MRYSIRELVEETMFISMAVFGFMGFCLFVAYVVATTYTILMGA